MPRQNGQQRRRTRGRRLNERKRARRTVKPTKTDYERRRR